MLWSGSGLFGDLIKWLRGRGILGWAGGGHLVKSLAKALMKDTTSGNVCYLPSGCTGSQHSGPEVAHL